MSMLSRMQNMMQQTIQQSIGALLPQLTHAASGGGAAFRVGGSLRRRQRHPGQRMSSSRGAG